MFDMSQDFSLTVLTHPLIQHKLSLLRKKHTSTSQFRQLLQEIAMLMTYEVTRDLPTSMVNIETPLESMQTPCIDGKKLVFASILRAGNGFLDGMLQVVPSARVGHIGLFRNHETLEAIEYYFKMPDEMHERDVIVVDPMLATGNSAIAAIDRLKQLKPKSIKFMCLLTCKEGVHALQAAHRDVPIYCAAVDRELSSVGYILPGLGDAGDRIYGTQ
jgi:uracil phosphoribosyltransferase